MRVNTVLGEKVVDDVVLVKVGSLDNGVETYTLAGVVDGEANVPIVSRNLTGTFEQVVQLLEVVKSRQQDGLLDFDPFYSEDTLQSALLVVVNSDGSYYFHPWYVSDLLQEELDRLNSSETVVAVYHVYLAGGSGADNEEDDYESYFDYSSAVEFASSDAPKYEDLGITAVQLRGQFMKSGIVLSLKAEYKQMNLTV